MKSKKFKNPQLQRQKEENKCCYQNILSVTVKNQDLLKSKNVADYYYDLINI